MLAGATVFGGSALAQQTWPSTPYQTQGLPPNAGYVVPYYYYNYRPPVYVPPPQPNQPGIVYGYPHAPPPSYAPVVPYGGFIHDGTRPSIGW